MSAELAWAAGLFEGEGCISRANTKSVRLDLALKARDADVIRRFRRVLQRGKIYGPYRNGMLHWLVFGREASVSVLLDLWPWLGKRRRATAIKHFPRLRRLRIGRQKQPV
jgi:hypothetical protein